MARTRVSQSIVEVLVPFTPAAPSTPTGAGVSQYVVEVLGSFPGSVRVSQSVVEVLMAEDDTQSDPPSGGGTTPSVHVFGYAG
ncbi:MAG: hypothetical protein NTV85_28620 [Hyphomicrobiales bacterium]|nr:hypothetical protein [Hyphomicrobiales bacterium]